MKSGTVHIGVDVSKEKLDIYVPAKEEGSRPLTKEVDNDINGFRGLRDLARKAKATVCVEPTGGYELELIAFMHKFDVPVAYTDALRVRQFARAEGNLAKNDRIDAALISRFADKIGVRLIEAQDVEAVELKRKAKFRQTIMDLRTAMANRLETEIDPEMRAMLRAQIKGLDRLIDKTGRLCLETVGKNERMNTLRERFTLVGGVGCASGSRWWAGWATSRRYRYSRGSRRSGRSPTGSSTGSSASLRRRTKAGRRIGFGESGAGERTCATRSTWLPSHRSSGTQSSVATTARSGRRAIRTSGR